MRFIDVNVEHAGESYAVTFTVTALSEPQPLIAYRRPAGTFFDSHKREVWRSPAEQSEAVAAMLSDARRALPAGV